MDEEILKAFEEIRAKLKEFNITEEWLIEGINYLNINRLTIDDCREIMTHINPFLSWYMESGILNNMLSQDIIKKISFESFLNFERKAAGIQENIITDEEMRFSYIEATKSPLDNSAININMAFFQGVNMQDIYRRTKLAIKGLLLIFADLGVLLVTALTVVHADNAMVGNAISISVGYLMTFSIRAGEKMIKASYT